MNLGGKFWFISCLNEVVGRRSVDGEIVQIWEIHRLRQIYGHISPVAGLMVVIQAKHDGESWKVKLKEDFKKEKGNEL